LVAGGPQSFAKLLEISSFTVGFTVDVSHIIARLCNGGV
jgi:hypothetical protein